MSPSAELSRRRFLASTAAWGAALALRPFDLGAAVAATPVAERPWAGVWRLGDGVWAVVSTPTKANDWTTGCNGGIIAGGERVLLIESFAQAAGAEWAAATARELTGRPPTDVLVTHYHGDHSGGLGGLTAEPRPRLWVTEATRELILGSGGHHGGPDPVRAELLAGATLLPAEGPTELDLGGLTVRLHARTGHTASDVTVEIDAPSIVFFGDLLWNGFFPNYRDTTPSAFAASIRAARRREETVYVPGHGALADDRAVGLCLTLADAIEEAARAALEKGISAADAAREFRLPAAVADWTAFNERYPEVAIGAWYGELG